MLEHPPDALHVGIAQLLNGYEERGGQSLFEARQIELRYLDDAGIERPPCATSPYAVLQI